MSGAVELDDGGALNRLASSMLAASARTAAAGYVLLQRHGVQLQTQVQANATGRPGPNAPTGDYRRSIALQISKGLTQIVATVGTNKVQGPRLELGFDDVDSLGRAYEQPPYPHFGPATDQIAPGFNTDVAKLGAEVLDDTMRSAGL